MKNCLFILFIFLSLQALGQTTRYKFRIRYNDYSALSNSHFLIGGQDLVTDPQGVISFNISSQLPFVNIGSANTKAYQIKYPQEGRAILPKDPAVFVDIFVQKPAPDAIKIISSIAGRQDAHNAELLRQIRAMREDARKGHNSIVELLNKNVFDESTLAKGRLEFFPLISNALNRYLVEAKDFNDAFSAVGSSPDNRESYEQFALAIENYNEIFELLNDNKSTYEQAISTYWNSKELSLKFSNLIDYTLEEIHKTYILEVNYTFQNRLYQYSNEQNRKKRGELLKPLKNDIQGHSASLARRLNIVGERIAGFTTLLNNNNRVSN